VPRLPRITGAEVVRKLARDGWFIERQGKHPQFRHATKPGTIPVPFHAGQIVKPGTLRNIILHAGLTVEQFIAL